MATAQENQRLSALTQSSIVNKRLQDDISKLTKTDFPTWDAAQSEQGRMQMDSIMDRQTNNRSSIRTSADQQKQEQGRLSSRLKQLRNIRKQYVDQLAASPMAEAVTVANQAWAKQVDLWQSGLAIGVWGFDIVVSDWLFILIWLARVFSPLLPKPRGLQIVPSYSLRTMGGIGTAISHAGTAFFAGICYLIIIVFVGIIAWFVMQIVNGSFLEKIQALYYLFTGPLTPIYDVLQSAL
ncbi:MAG: hypothetical protein WCT08_02820 [Patescibacteria group bacterium]|jgi:hypothetical protein